MSLESSALAAHAAAATRTSQVAPADLETRALHGQLPTDKELVLKVIPMPRDCNANGDIFGG